jgi:hypothetical protein
MNMNKVYLSISIILFSAFLYPKEDYSITEKKVASYFETIRNKESFLRQFFQDMPKGADLHHHYSGAVYAETYLQYVEEKNLWVNRLTFEILDQPPPTKERDIWSKVNSLKSDGYWEVAKREIIKLWSVKDYNNNASPADEHFFSTFGDFYIPKDSTYRIGLLEIKERAKKENTFYIETMLSAIKFDSTLQNENALNYKLLELQMGKDTAAVQEYLATILKSIPSKSIDKIITKYNRSIQTWHDTLKIDDEDFKLRYLNYVNRTADPVTIFKNLLVAFKSDIMSKLIVGVNFVAPENNEKSIRDYWLHMQMFKFFHELYPTVRYSLHAGELVLGLVKPEDLTWHIHDAIYTAHAKRIGHGVDIMYETGSDKVLKFMKQNEIAVEINLSSNDFILGVKGDKHPFLIYNKYDVPIVICTDDAGILRTDLTQQYVVLAMNYPQISYSSIKKYVFNSIQYSFLDDSLKNVLKKKLESRFAEFEMHIAGI